MSIYDALYRCIEDNPEICTNIKRFRATLLDLSMDDTTSVNLIELAMKNGLHYKISKISRSNQREIQNIITDFAKSYSINNSRIGWLTEFFTNVFAERDLVEKGERGTRLRFAKKGNFLLLDTEQLPIPEKNYIPCGSGNKDYGFIIHGLNEEANCVHPLANIYAVTFGILQRSLNINPSKYIKDYEQSNKAALNYSIVYRLEMIILLLIKNNYIKDNIVSIIFDGNINDLNAAVGDINNIASTIASLAKIEYKPLKYVFNKKGTTISQKEGEGAVSYTNVSKRETECRYAWIERNIIYDVDKTNEDKLDILLENIFDFSTFLNGQKDSLIRILNGKDNRSICILPTGRGKSLIYYFVAMLQSCSTIVITPSDILIKDQIRNLKLFHGIDDVLEIRNGMRFENFVPSNKFIFVTPMTVMDRKLINRLIDLNNKQIIGSVILDEIHCISNWSHDFRPEYLMLSFILTEFVDKTRYIGFTATANYSVILDVKNQLKIKDEDIISLLSIKNGNVKFKYTSCNTIEDIYKEVSSEIEGNMADSTMELKRTMVFTRTEDESEKVYDFISEKDRNYVDIYNGHLESYIDFAEGETDVIIADDTMGIGINMPSVTSIIHVGAPISKSEYVQQMGRAGRNGIASTSSVAYIGRDKYIGEYKKLIDRNVKVEDILTAESKPELELEYKTIVGKIFGNIESKPDFMRKVLTVADSVMKLDLQSALAFNVKDVHDYSEVSKIMRYLYVLHKTGVIYSWYLEGVNEKEGIVSFYIDQGKEKATLTRVIETSLKYINSLGSYKKITKTIKESESIQDVILGYVEWHYSQLLYYHREQFIDMLDYLEIYKDKSDIEKEEAIANYFSLSIIDVERDVKNANKLSIKDIIKYALSSPTMAVADNMRKSNEGKYNVKIDLFLLLYNVLMFDDFDVSRYKRVLQGLTKAERDEFIDNIALFYDRLMKENKILLIKELEQYEKIGDLLDKTFSKMPKDEVYFGIIAKHCNKAFENK